MLREATFFRSSMFKGWPAHARARDTKTPEDNCDLVFFSADELNLSKAKVCVWRNVQTSLF